MILVKNGQKRIYLGQICAKCKFPEKSNLCYYCSPTRCQFSENLFEINGNTNESKENGDIIKQLNFAVLIKYNF